MLRTYNIQQEINSLPAHLKQEVYDFIAFLKTKTKAGSALKEREIGFAKGKIKIAADFNAPLDEFKDYE